MPDVTEHRRLLATAREHFLDGADERLRGVPNHVAASWRRSASSGVHPSRVTSEYHHELDLGSRLVRCADPVMEQLAEQLSGGPACVALTDDRARILARRDSSAAFGRLLDRVYFAQGFGYAEGSVGTNGVGTVLEFGGSVHIVGAEHFVDTLQSFACAGAPIRDPLTGRVAGVLDISCLSEHSTPILHSMVRAAATQIERNLLMDRNQCQQALFEAFTLVEARNRDAVLAVGRRVTMANTQLQTLLAPVDQQALHDHARFVMSRRDVVDERLELPSGSRVRLRGTTITVGPDVAGLVAVVTVLGDPPTERAPARRPGRARPVPTGRTPSVAPIAVVSTSPAFRTATATVAAALRAGTPILVLGEPGSGRYSLLADLWRESGGRRTEAVSPQQVDAAPGAAAAGLGALGRGAVLRVLRDVDRLSRPALGALVAGLSGGAGCFAATASDQAPNSRTLEPLLAMFHACATIPPLRHRGGDLPVLIQGVLGRLAPQRDVRLSPEALRLAARYAWPGNVGQLEDALAAALRQRPVGCIEAGDLPAYCQSAPRRALRPVDEIERDAIIAALRDAGGNRVAAAAALGLARSTLYRKIRQYGITA